MCTGCGESQVGLQREEELSMDAFAEQLGPHLGVADQDGRLAQLFMQIDADCGGTVDWCAEHDCCAEQFQRCAPAVHLKAELSAKQGRVLKLFLPVQPN